jgi:hypothetical protein
MNESAPVLATRGERLSALAISAATAVGVAVVAGAIVGWVLMVTVVRPTYPGESLESMAAAAPGWVPPVLLTADVLFAWLVTTSFGKRTTGDAAMSLTTIGASGLPAWRAANLARTAVPAALLLVGALAHQIPLALVVFAAMWAPALRGAGGRSLFDRLARVRVVSYNVRRRSVDQASAEKWARMDRKG